tara:strand:+ start:654 stop:1148 length:495 start_codon:yes stop_codon:yes gene_type:complete
MNAFLKRSLLGGIIVLSVVLVSYACTGSFDRRDSLEKFHQPKGNPYHIERIVKTEKKVFRQNHDKNKSDSRRATWEGMLASDSIERTSCKQACLDDYGIGATDLEGSLCDDRGWNKCLNLMDWGVFKWRSCAGVYKEKCKDCWVLETQSCYDEAFLHCVNRCPK